MIIESEVDTMKIIRDGIEIELTNAEINTIYHDKRVEILREKLDNEICGFYSCECWYRKYSKNEEFRSEVLNKAAESCIQKLDAPSPHHSMYSAVLETVEEINEKYRAIENKYKFSVELNGAKCKGYVEVNATDSELAYETAMEVVSNCIQEGFEGYLDTLDIEFDVEEVKE